jgi:hypothetical protein
VHRIFMKLYAEENLILKDEELVTQSKEKKVLIYSASTPSTKKAYELQVLKDLFKGVEYQKLILSSPV